MDSLPPISEMYSSTRENHDYGVTRTYQDYRRTTTSKKIPTKRGHYLQDHVKGLVSPGPANASNFQEVWASKSAKQLKYSERKTYIDQIQHQSRKKNLPAPSHYKVEMPWPVAGQPVKNICERLSFVDTCLYESDKTPGPGMYQVAKKLAGKIGEGKLNINKPLQPRNDSSADMTTYNPISMEFSTFSRIQKKNKENSSAASPKAKSTLDKENKKKSLVPGPGHYQMINTWIGKNGLKKGEQNYWIHISKGSTPNLYY